VDVQALPATGIPIRHHQLLTNGLDATGLGDVMACVKAGGNEETYIGWKKKKQRARTNQEPDDRHV